MANLGEMFFGLLSSIVDRTEVKISKSDYSVNSDKKSSDDNTKKRNSESK